MVSLSTYTWDQEHTLFNLLLLFTLCVTCNAMRILKNNNRNIPLAQEEKNTLMEGIIDN